MLSTGDTAPDFELSGAYEGDIDTYRLSDYTGEGTNVLLSFYSFDFHPICTEGMCALRDAEFFQLRDDLAVLGVSTDSAYAHRQFAADHDINYPLLADTDGSVAEAYGVLRDAEGMNRVAKRAAYLVDADRTVAFAAAVDADSPADIDLNPLNDAVRAFSDEHA